MNRLIVNKVHYEYGNKAQPVKAVNGVSCEFQQGRVYAVTGVSGSGKTTFLSLLAGLDVPASGSIELDGISTSVMNRDEYRLNHVSVIYQNFNLFQHLTALENAAYPLYIRKLPKKKAEELAKEKLLHVGLKEDQFKRLPTMLSGGEQQRVAIARALVNNPSTIVADEPTGNLDPGRSLEIMTLLERINALGTTVIVVTHERGLVNHFNKRIILLNDGQVIGDGLGSYEV